MGDPLIRSKSRLLVALCLGTIAAASAGITAPACAQEGQIVILRKVPPRIAYREAVPAPPFAVKTAPEVDLSAIDLSATEGITPSVVAGVPGATLISDLEAASIAANTALLGGVDELGSRLGSQISGQLGGNFTGIGKGSSGGAVAAQLGQLGLLSQSRLSAAGGSVRRATDGLGQTIVHAVAPQ